MIPDTDWQEGFPPNYIELDIFIRGNVRRGWREGQYFHYTDCNNPFQNSTVPIDDIKNWKTRDSVEHTPSYDSWASSVSGLNGYLFGKTNVYQDCSNYGFGVGANSGIDSFI